MQFQRIRVPAPGLVDIPTNPSNPSPALTVAVLNQARRALGAGPTWGRPAAAGLLLAYAAGVLLACHSGWIATPTIVAVVAAVGGVVLTLAGRWTRGVDFNAWVEADPRHRRGSCQWLIWPGEYSGQPCLACLASMPRHERRRWLAASESPAVVAGWLGAPAWGRGPERIRDAGAVSVGWLAWQLLPVGLLTLAVHRWASPDPVDRQTALPLALATVVTAAINFYLARAARAQAVEQDTDRAPLFPAVCESCGQMPASVAVHFSDAVFVICATCLAGGAHPPGRGPDAADATGCPVGPIAPEVPR